jgi:alkylresorcinol/alkylpyrone synthase
MPFIHSIFHSVPETIISQDSVKQLARELFNDSGIDIDRLMPIFRNAKIDSRPICMPVEWYSRKKSFKEKNEEFLKHSLILAKESALGAIAKAGITKEDVGALIVVTSSGFVTPTLDARLMDLLELPLSIIRLPLVGLGCAGGASGLSRAREIANAYPDKYVLLIAVETCTITFRPGDKRKANLVALSLFSDGATSVVISAKEKKRSIKLTSSSSFKWKDSLDVMGWDIEEDGLQVVFDKSIPDLIHANYKEVYDSFVSKSKLKILHHLYHPGGKKVIDAISSSLNIPLEKLRYSEEVLRKFGNISSPTVLIVIEEFLQEGSFNSNEFGTIAALGPGFSSEILIFETT